jgi:hypothetical protein
LSDPSILSNERSPASPSGTAAVPRAEDRLRLTVAVGVPTLLREIHLPFESFCQGSHLLPANGVFLPGRSHPSFRRHNLAPQHCAHHERSPDHAVPALTGQVVNDAIGSDPKSDVAFASGLPGTSGMGLDRGSTRAGPNSHLRNDPMVGCQVEFSFARSPDRACHGRGVSRAKRRHIPGCTPVLPRGFPIAIPGRETLSPCGLIL